MNLDTNRNNRLAGMRLFLIVWAGQTFSRFGSYLTMFALFQLWLWQQTEQASTLAIAGVIAIGGGLVASLAGGVLVDRFKRKTVMILTDGCGALVTLVFLLLHISDSLEIWHLYAGIGVLGFFNQLHGLAFSAAITMMVKKAQYTRAGSLRFLTHYGAVIFAPPLTAVLYNSVGLTAIMVIDLLTVSAAILTVAFVDIPQPPESEAGRASKQSKFTQIIYGFRYIRQNPSLFAVISAVGLFMFFHDLTIVVHTPMILARTDNNINVLAGVGTAAGLGGLAGSIIMTAWGGAKKQMRVWLLGTMGAGLAKMAMSIMQTSTGWFPAQFSSSINFPIRGGSLQSILMAKVEPDVQGRFFAAQDIVVSVAVILARIAAPIADYGLEPAMTSDTWLTHSLGWLFGTSAGSGYAIIYFSGAVAMFLIGLFGFRVNALYNIENLLPDHEAAED